MSEIAYQYALAFYELNNSMSERLQGLQDLTDLCDALKMEDLRSVINHPLIDKDAKKDIFRESLKNKANLFLSFIYCLIDNNRLNILDDILNEYNQLLNKEQKILEVTIYTKYELKVDKLNIIMDYLKKQYQMKTIKPKIIIDDNITYGVRLKVNNDIMDVTVDELFNKIKEEIR